MSATAVDVSSSGSSSQRSQRSRRNAEPGPDGVDVLFCGNPGAGKSTLLSWISGLFFMAGISWGSGLTTKLDFQVSPLFPDIRFGDTPGLADIDMIASAAAAITQALYEAARNNRILKLFFVVTTEAGRIRPSDLLTIKKVLESIVMPNGSKLGPNAYGVIVNKCDFLEHPGFIQKGEATLRDIVGVKSASVPFTTSCVHFLPWLPVEELSAEQVEELAGPLRAFVLLFPGIEGIVDVVEIETRSFDELLDSFFRQHQQDRKDLEQRLQQEREAVEKEMNANILDLKEKLAKAEKQSTYLQCLAVAAPYLGLALNVGLQFQQAQAGIKAGQEVLALTQRLSALEKSSQLLSNAARAGAGAGAGAGQTKAVLDILLGLTSPVLATVNKIFLKKA